MIVKNKPRQIIVNLPEEKPPTIIARRPMTEEQTITRDGKGRIVKVIKRYLPPEPEPPAMPARPKPQPPTLRTLTDVEHAMRESAKDWDGFTSHLKLRRLPAPEDQR